jgi:GxxExxY protein
MLRIKSPLPDTTERLAAEIVDAVFEVHKELGPGLLESAYKAALTIELEPRSLSFEREREVLLHYKGRPLMMHRLDLVVGGEVLVELKAVERLHPVHLAQVISYLKSANLHLGLLVNFNAAWIKGNIRRIVL